MTKKEKLAKIVRTVTVPPVMVFLLLMILFFAKPAIFATVPQLLVSILCLMVIPVLAYPIASLVPKYKDNLRDGQRKIAFMLSLAGYAAAVVYGFAAHVSPNLMLIYLTYFISVVILTIFDKVIGLKASGHACSIAGPLISMAYFIGWACVLPCAALFALIIWSSLALKRHTPKELILGSGSAATAFAVSLLLIALL
jgi:hypothetical protein